MEHRFRKSSNGFQANTDDDLALFGVFLSEELQREADIALVLQHVVLAQAQPAREQLWRGRHYALTILNADVTVRHLSDSVSAEDFASQVDGTGYAEVQQVSVAGLADFSELLLDWQDFLYYREVG